MPKTDSFFVDQAFEINLAALNYGPVPLGIGQVQRVIRFPETTKALARTYLPPIIAEHGQLLTDDVRKTIDEVLAWCVK